MLLFSRLLFLTSALRPTRARCGAIREATLPPCSPPLLPLPGPALPLVCSFSLVLPCPPSQAPVSLALCLPVSVFPLPPRRTLCGAIRVASLPLSLHLSAPWCPGPRASGTHVALHPPVAFFLSALSARPPSSSLAPLPRPLGPWPSVSLSPSSLYRLAYTSRSNTRGIPPTPSSPCRPLVPRSLGLWHARRTAPACGLCPSTPALPPPPSPAPFPLGHYARHCVGKSHACRRHAPGLYRRRRRAGSHHAVAARRCHSPRTSRRRGQPLQMPRGARPW